MSCTCPTHPSLERWLWTGFKIRSGLAPDEPRLLDQFIAEGQALAATGQVLPWLMGEYQFTVLVQSVRSPALPWHWRRLCLDYAHRPLKFLAREVRNPKDYARLEKLGFHLACLKPPTDPTPARHPGS